MATKRKKGVSLDEKRRRLLEIYHNTKEVFNLKEVEKLGAKAGIVLQTVKDVNQALIDDGLVDTEKIGAGNYFWSFPSKHSQKLQTKLEKLKASNVSTEKNIEALEKEIENLKGSRVESDERVQKMQKLAEFEKELAETNKQLDLHKENDPEVLATLENSVKVCKDGCDRWTDNVFSVRQWCARKHGISTKEVDRMLGITGDNFDYIE